MIITIFQKRVKKEINNLKSVKAFYVILRLIMIIIIFAAVTKLSVYITDVFAKGSFKYIWLFMHHTIQLIIIIAIMILPVWSKSMTDWGINAKNKEMTMRIIKKFSIGWIFCTLIYIMVSSWVYGYINLVDFEINSKNIIIYLLFESTIVGISEEIFFRGLIRGILYKDFNKKIKLGGFAVSGAGMIAAVLFAFAHIGVQLFPFAITHLDTIQVIIAFALGIFYEAVLEKTNSLLGPILAHNITDTWLSVLFIIIELIGKGI